MKLLSIGTLIFFTSMLCAFQIKSLSPEQEITQLLNEFLQKVDKKEMHDRFWGEDLVYTSSGGERFGKDKIMQGFDAEEEESSEEATVSYSSDEVEVKVFGKVAVLTFQLVADTDEGISRYWNSGTLVKRKGSWKVVAWQATIAKE